MLEDIGHASGVLTIIVSFIGAFVAFWHVFFYQKSKSEIAKKMKAVFFSDGLIYLITLAFGLWALYEWGYDAAIAMHVIRIPILLLNIWASVRLYNHYKELHENDR